MVDSPPTSSETPADATAHHNKREVDLSVPVEKLPAWVWLLSVGLLIGSLIPYGVLYGVPDILGGLLNPLLLPLFVLLIVAHEVVHAIGWKVSSGLAWRDFKFGFLWKSLSPYCHAKKPMPVMAYRIGAALPGIVTGVLPLLVALLTGDGTLAVISAVMISAAVGDIYVLWSVRNVPDNAELIDHPSQAGCIALIPDA